MPAVKPGGLTDCLPDPCHATAKFQPSGRHVHGWGCPAALGRPLGACRCAGLGGFGLFPVLSGAVGLSGGTCRGHRRGGQLPGIVIQVECRRTYFCRNTGHHCGWLRRQYRFRRPQGRNRGATTQAHLILQEHIGAQAELLGHVTGHSGTQIAGAGADEQRVQLGGNDAGLAQRRGQGAGGELRRFHPESLVEFVGGQRKDTFDAGHRKMPGGDAAVVPQNEGDGVGNHAVVRHCAVEVANSQDPPWICLGKGCLDLLFTITTDDGIMECQQQEPGGESERTNPHTHICRQAPRGQSSGTFHRSWVVHAIGQATVVMQRRRAENAIQSDFSVSRGSSFTSTFRATLRAGPASCHGVKPYRCSCRRSSSRAWRWRLPPAQVGGWRLRSGTRSRQSHPLENTAPEWVRARSQSNYQRTKPAAQTEGGHSPEGAFMKFGIPS